MGPSHAHDPSKPMVRGMHLAAKARLCKEK